MKKLLLMIAATAGSSLVMFPVKLVQAASLGFTVTENVTDDTTPAPGVPGLQVFKNLISAQGQITEISGFSSLQGVAPSSLTLNYGNLELLSATNQNGILHTTSGNDGSKTPYFNLLENGQVIATSNNLSGFSDTNVTAFSPNYGKATGILTIALNGVSGNPFFEEIQQLTNGTGILELTLGTPVGIIPVSTISTDTKGSFTYTGGTLLAQSPTPTPVGVPEPSTVGGFLVIGAGWLAKRKMK